MTGLVSSRDRSDQRLDPDDVHNPGQIIGQDREGHLGGYLWERFGQGVRRPHAGFHRAERMFDRLATLAHGLWVCIKPLLHSFEQMLMLPSCRCAGGFARWCWYQDNWALGTWITLPASWVP